MFICSFFLPCWHSKHYCASQELVHHYPSVITFVQAYLQNYKLITCSWLRKTKLYPRVQNAEWKSSCLPPTSKYFFKIHSEAKGDNSDDPPFPFLTDDCIHLFSFVNRKVLRWKLCSDWWYYGRLLLRWWGHLFILRKSVSCHCVAIIITKLGCFKPLCLSGNKCSFCFALFCFNKGCSSKGFFGLLFDQKNIIFFRKKRKNEERKRGREERMKKGKEQKKEKEEGRKKERGRKEH